MLKLKEIKKIIEEYIPDYLQEAWDNSGMIIGDENAEIEKALITLDVTDSVIEEAVKTGSNLIISHHPVIFDGLKIVDYGTPIGNRIRKLIANNINVLSYHTNFDKVKGGTTDSVCSLLELKNIKNLTDEEYSFGKIGEISPMPLYECIAMVKDNLGLKSVKYCGNENDIIRKIAIVSGSGSEFYIDAFKSGADLFITAEVKHHIAIDCMDLNMAIADAGHFETENLAMNNIYKILEKKIEVSITKEYTELFKYM